jgi:hypothetical protein
MNARQGAAIGIAVVGALALIFLLFPPLQFVDPGEYETATVTVTGDTTVAVEVRVADTRAKRRVGLMRTDSLADGTGMLFVHPSEGSYTYHMRNVAFDIDMLFLDANGTVTTVHHATAPEAGADSDRYTGRGKYVLEVPRGFANRTGVGPGDRVSVPERLS